MMSLRLSLLSFTALGLAATGVLAQEAPPVSDPAAGQRPPILAPVSPTPSDPPAAPAAVPAPVEAAPVEAEPEAEPDDGDPATAEETPLPPPAAPPVVPIPAVWAPAPVNREGHTAYGLYLGGRNLVGRSAEGDGEAALGAQYLAEVQALTPEQPTVREQAFTASLLAGNLQDAARIAPSGEGVSPVLGEAGRLVQGIEAFARGDARAATAVFKAGPIQMPHAPAGLLTQRWIAAAAGDWDFALVAPPATANDTFSQVLRFQRAQLLEAHRRYDEAEAEFKALAASPTAQPPFHAGYGGYLERRRRKDEAIAVYDAALAANPDSALLKAARERISGRNRAPGLPGFRDGVVQGLTLAASLASENRANEFAAVYLRLALDVAPSDDLRLLLGGALVGARLEAASRDALAQIGPGNAPAYAAARLQIGASLGREDRKDEALAEFRKAYAAAPRSPDIAYALATQLLELKRNEEALEILNGPVLNTPQQPAAVRFVRGAAYEGAGKIAEAETELSAAVEDQPDEPSFLNYLGYLWVDSGTKVAEGAALIARAHAAQPNDGNIQDSLGWAQFRQGQYETAVVTLEEAVDKEPANAEINDHLGDAYWQVGRKREAGFQWKRVLTLDPDAERKAAVERKLAEGLPPQTPVLGPVAAPAVTPPAALSGAGA